MKKNKIFLFVFVALSLVFSDMFFVANLANAEETPDYKIAVSPGQQSFESLEPGEVYSGKFEVKNMGKEDFDYVINFSPYSVESETYTADFVNISKYTDLYKWLNVDSESGHIEAGKKVEVNYNFTVPENAAGGMQAASIMISMDNVDNGDGNVQAVHRLAYLIYGNVDGDVIKTGKILENKIPSFLFTPPITATSVVENTGNVYTVAQYSLQVFPLFSDEEIYTNEETPEGNVVFPETKKLNTISWEGAPQLGIFKVRQTVKIFDEESVTEKLVFLCPLWFLFIVVLLVFCIIFWIVSRIIKRKKENY